MEDYAKDMGMIYGVSFLREIFDRGSVGGNSGSGAYHLGHQMRIRVTNLDRFPAVLAGISPS